MHDRRFKGLENRPVIAVPGRVGASMRSIIDDLNASQCAVIRVTPAERAAAQKIVDRSNGAVFLTRSLYMKISTAWSA